MLDFLNNASPNSSAVSADKFYYFTAYDVLVVVLDDLFKLNLFLSLCLGCATLFITVFSAFVVAFQHGCLAAFYPVFAEMIALKSWIREHETMDDPDTLEDEESVELFKEVRCLCESVGKEYYWKMYCSTTVVQIAPLAATILSILVAYHFNLRSVMDSGNLDGYLIRFFSVAVLFLILRFSREVRCTIFRAYEAKFSTLKEPLASYAECLLTEAAYSVRLIDAATLLCVLNLWIMIFLLLAITINSGFFGRCSSLGLTQCYAVYSLKFLKKIFATFLELF